MQLDWTTFILEVVNFLVLVWILRHFFLKPIAAAIEKRRNMTQAVLEEAKQKETAAQSLKAGYEQRLAEWKTEHDTARHALQQELEKVRAAGLDRFRAEISAEREKAQARQAQQAQRQAIRQQQDALAVAMQFTAKLLRRIASPAVETRLVQAALEDLRNVKPDQFARNADDSADRAAQVSSAYPLSEEIRKEVSNVLNTMLGSGTPVEFATDDSLLAGLRIRFGARIIDANLADELRFFTTSFTDDSRA